jgi:hypothetical protein
MKDKNQNNKNSNKKSNRGSYGNAGGPVINRGGIRGVRHFACKFPQKMARCVADVVTKPCNNYFKSSNNNKKKQEQKEHE